MKHHEPCPQALGLHADLEAPAVGGLLYADVAVRYPDGRWAAIEVDGPWHFHINQPLRATGSTALRDNCLRSSGFAGATDGWLCG